MTDDASGSSTSELLLRVQFNASLCEDKNNEDANFRFFSVGYSEIITIHLLCSTIERIYVPEISLIII